jgi:tRNA (guanosine-2'-O-)-methyltransferase
MATNRPKLPVYRSEERKVKLRNVLEKRQPDLTVVLENINDTHNLSAVLRSCDAVGILQVCLVYYGDQEFPMIANSSSASAGKWIDIRRFYSIEDCFAALRAEGKKIYTTHMATDAVSLYDLNLVEPVALVFGNEHSGVSDKAVELADNNFLIPQVGMIQSLNISVACAVSLYEAFRQRNDAGYYTNPRIIGNDFDSLLADWLQK